MARSKFRLGNKIIDYIKLGVSDTTAYLGIGKVYPLEKPLEDAIVTCNSATYDGTVQVAQNIIVTLSGETLVENTDYIISSNTGGTNVGNYIVAVSGIGTYSGIATGTFTINKVTPTVVAPTAKVLTYNGSAQELVNAGSTDFGTLQYRVSSDSWSTSIPTRTRGGSYTVEYKVVGDSNINDVAAQSVQCSINSKQVTATVTLSQTAYTYNGSACQPTPTVSDGGTVIPSSEYTVTYSNNINAGTGTCTISDNVGGDYNVIGSATFTINKANPTYTAPTTKTELVYTGSAQSLLNAASTSDGTIQYSSDNSTWSTTIPTGTNANTYTSYWRLVGDSNHNDVASTSISTTIAKASGSVSTNPTAKSLTYNGSAQALVNAGSGTGTMMYKLDSGSWGTSIPSGTNATSYTVYYKASASTNYNESASGSVSCSIAKVTPTVTAPTAKSLTYNGSSQALVNAGSTNWGTLKYSLDNSTYSTSIPSGTNATSYTVYYKVDGDSNINNVAAKSVAVSIAKASGSVSTNPTAKSLTYNGNSQALVNAGSGTGTMMYKLGSGSWGTSIPSASTAGSYTVYYKASASTNYNESASGSVSCSIAKANISPTVSISNWTYGGTASNPSVAGNSGSGTVVYYYKLSSASSWSTTKPSNASSYNIKAEISATTNYNSGSCTNNFTINKANSSLSFTVASVTLESGETKTNAVTVNAGDGTVTYSSNNTSVATVNNSGVVTGVGVGDATITANISSTNNYNSASTSYTVSCIEFVTAKFNVTDTSSPTMILSSTTSVSTVYIDGVKQSSVTTGYTFGTTGSHTVKYALKNTSLIGASAFSGCRTLTSIVIPNSVTSIGNYAFQYCSGLTSVNIPSGVTSIGTSVFAYCCSLSSVTVNSNNTTYNSRNNCNAIIETSTNTLIVGCKNTVIPNTVTSIGTYAFASCSGLTSVTIPSCVTTIGSNAFNGCISLTSIDIPSGVTSIGSSTFKDCTSFTSITVKATTPPTLGYDAFTNTNNCPIYVPTCSLVSTYKSANRWSSYAAQICALDCLILTEKLDVTSTSTSKVIAGPGIYDSFNGLEVDGVRKSLASAYTFSTTGEHTVKLSLKGTTIGEKALHYGTFKSVIIPSGVTSIGSHAFAFCSGMTSVTIPDTVTYIGYRAFMDCKKLTSVNIPNGSINNDAFISCTGLTSATIGDRVTSIGTGVFTACSGLTTCTIGSGLTSIPDSTFYNCRSLTGITIPSGVTSIGSHAFYQCSSLTSITVKATTPPTLGNNAIYSTNNCPIYVPSGSVTTYKSASGWSDYASRIQAIP